MSKNARLTAYVPQEVANELERYAAASGLKTASTLLAAAAVEFKRAAEKGLNLYHVLGRIAADDDAQEKPSRINNRAALTEAR